MITVDDRGLLHVASAVLEHLAEEYMEIYRRAVWCQYVYLYLTEAIANLERAGYDVGRLLEARQGLLEEQVEDLDAFFDTRLGHAVCEILSLHPDEARKRIREYARETLDVESVRNAALESVKRMCREALQLRP